MRSGALSFLMVVLLAQMARGAGFEASVQVKQAKREPVAATYPAAAGGLHAKRPVFEGDRSNQFTARWKVVRTAKDEVKDVLVHFYVVKIERSGQAPPPLEPKRVVIESALTMDFPPGERSESSVQFRIDEPGLYLMRIEAAGSDQPEPQDFAAVELRVK